MVFKSWRRPSKEQDPSPDLIHKLDPKVIESLPLDVLLRLPPDRLRYLPPPTLARLPLDHLELAPPEVLAWLPADILVKLSHSKLASLPIEGLRRLPVDSLVQLPPDSLAKLPPGDIARLPPEALGRLDNLPVDLFNRLPHHVLRHLPRSLLAKLPTDSLQRLPLDVLSDLRVMLGNRVEAGTQSSHQHQPAREEQEQDTEITRLAVPGELGRSKTVSHFVIPMHERNSEAAHGKGASTPFSKIDNSTRIAQKRASYRHLRHTSRDETSQAATAPGAGTSSAAKASKLQMLSPLEAVIADAKDLQRMPERRSRSDGMPRSMSISEPTQRSGPEPPPKRPLSPDKTVSIPSQRHSPNASLPRDEPRVPSSGSQMSIQRQTSLRQRPADDKPVQGTVEEAVHGAQRPVSFDSRATTLRLSDGPGPSNKDPEPTRVQIPPSTQTQLEISLRERDKVIVELQQARDHQTSRVKHYMAQSIQANRELKRQKDDYEKQLADMRNKLASEQARQEQNVLRMSKSHEEELDNQESSHQQRTKQLKLELLAQKANYDKRLQEERDKSKAELGVARQEFEAAKRKYEAQLENQKDDAMKQRVMQERETEERVAQYQDLLDSLRQEHKTSIDALTEQLATQAAAHEQQVAILTGQLEDQDTDYRLQIAQLIEKHAGEMQKQKKEHQVELDAQIKKSSAYMQSLGQQYEAQAQLERDHHQLEMQTQADRHRNDLQRQSLEHSRMLESIRTESGDFIRQASDDKLEGMFRQLKVAIEVVSEPFNLGPVVIQPGSSLDPTGILAREKGMQRHLLRSLMWCKIADGFFSAPFGFGVLGSGDGKQMLLEMFMRWRKLVPGWQNGQDGLPQPQSSDAFSLDLYDLWRDRDSNRWRSATFQSMLAVVTARRETKLPYHEAKPAVDSPYFRNCAAFTEEILELLKEATKDEVRREIEEKVDEVTRLAAELALEIGAHRAYLGLRFPKRGEKVAIGRDFVDCEDGDPSRGLSEEVEIVVCPQFFKVGDGRSDLTTTKSIFRGEIYPIRNDEEDASS